MEITKIAAFSMMTLFILLIMRSKSQEVAMQISIAASIMIFLLMISKVTAIINFLQNLSLKANIDFIYLSTVVKILGIAYIASFCSEICKDAGENSLASKIEFSGKVLILSLAIPILMAVLQSILKIL